MVEYLADLYSKKIMNYLRERKSALILAIIVALVTTIPYLAGYAAQGGDWRFSGFIIGVEDGNSYLAKMLSGAAGDWLFRTPYSAAQQKGVIAFLPYILLGKLTSQPAQHEQLVAIYQLFRVLGVFLAVLASYDFISIFIEKRELKMWALTLIVFGGGLGWILVLIGQKGFLGSLPLEFISPESFGFLALFGFPHLACSRALLLWGMTAFLKRENGFLAGVIWLGMGFFQPMVVVIAWTVISAHSLISLMLRLREVQPVLETGKNYFKEIFLKPVQAFLVSAPIIVYTGTAFLTDPYLKGWAEQNQLPSPPAAHYLIAYGLLLPLIYPGIKSLIKGNRYHAVLLTGWLVILPFLVYAPVNTQRRLAEGSWVVIVITSLAFFSNKEHLTWQWRTYLGLAFPSTILLMAGTIAAVTQPSEPVFRPREEILMYQALEESAVDRPVVLSSFEIGNTIPAWLPVRVVLGHGPESINRQGIETDLERIFSNMTADSDRNRLLNVYQVDYLIWGPIEKSQSTWTPRINPGLDLFYNEGEYSIFEVLGNR
jgi:hypothetical protein